MAKIHKREDVIKGREPYKVDRLAHLNNTQTKSNNKTGELSPKTQLISALTGALIFLFFFKTCFWSEDKVVEIVSNSAIDASVYQVENYLGKNLNDPDSYEGVEWSEVVELDNGSFVVRHKYRAKNALGGYVTNNQVFTLSSKGVVIDVKDYTN